MFVIVDKSNSSIHREPNKKSYSSTQYKSEAAAKAGITRTIKFYNKAKAQVAEVVANGEAEYTAPMYNAFRDATDPYLGRTHCGDVDNYVVMSYVDYMAIEPMVERTNLMTGKKFKESINTPHYMSASSETYWSS